MGMDGVPETSDDSLKFSVLQPGAAVATELTEVEAKKKSVGILMIKGEDWKLESLPLTTVRQQAAAAAAAKQRCHPTLTPSPPAAAPTTGAALPDGGDRAGQL